MPSRVQVAILLLVAFVFSVTSVAQPPSRFNAFLRERAAFSASDIGALDRGKILVYLPRGSERSEVVSLGVMRLDIPADFLVAQKRNIVAFKKSSNVLQVGRFSNPSRIEDLAAMVIEPDVIDSLRQCKVNSCDLKLPAAWIARFRNSINPSASDYRERAEALLKQMLLEHVQN
jgi:hypothetical protein